MQIVEDSGIISTSIINSDKAEGGFRIITPLNSDGATCRTYKVEIEAQLFFMKRLKETDLMQDEILCQIYKKEFEIGSKLDCQYIVRYRDFCEDEHGTYLLLDYVEGHTLKEILADNPNYFINKANLQKFVSQLLEGVKYLHEHQVVHLDLKDDNIMLTRVNNDVRILDLGFCFNDSFQNTIGRNGKFAAPEQLNDSRDVDARTDIYAIGKILRHIEEKTGRKLPKKYREIASKCIQEDKSKRFQTIEELIKELTVNRKRLMYSVISFLAFCAVGVCSYLCTNHDYDFKYDGRYFRILSEDSLTLELTYNPEGNGYVAKDMDIRATAEYKGKTYTVISIGDSAFAKSQAIHRVCIPPSVYRISHRAFKQARNLEEVTIPVGVKTIGYEAFASCDKLERIKLPDSLKVLPQVCFVGCVSLKEMIVPEGVEWIERDAFVGCSSLKRVSLPSTLKGLERGVFFGCSELEEIEIPANVETLGEYVFGDCKKLRNIYNYCKQPQSSIDLFCGGGKKIILHVPEEAIERYKKSSTWNCVKEIKAIE